MTNNQNNNNNKPQENNKNKAQESGNRAQALQPQQTSQANVKSRETQPITAAKGKEHAEKEMVGKEHSSKEKEVGTENKKDTKGSCAA